MTDELLLSIVFPGDTFDNKNLLVKTEQIAALFLLCDIPAVRTNIRKVLRWPVYAIEYLARKK